jgi:hypothetical protein
VKLVKIEEAKAGQPVAKDVTDLKGVLLFKKGTVLTDIILQRIRARNITHLFLEGEGEGGEETGPFKNPEEVDEQLDGVFGDTVSNPVMQALCEAAKRYHKGRMG